MHRIVLVCVLALIVGGMASCQGADTHQGKVVETSTGKLTMTDLEGKNQHTMDVPTTATVTRDGKTVTLADLKPGDTLTVTTAKTGTAPAVTRIEAKSTNS
jgi:ABC-type Fe3+-hydroxamate transport system substrate-binding protein